MTVIHESSKDPSAEKWDSTKKENGLPTFSDIETPSEVSSESSDDQGSTNWNAIILAGVVSFLGAVEGTVIGMAEWPYMKTIDHEATSQFFGIASSLSKGAHAIAALVFSWITYRYHSVKISLIWGRLIALIACLMYLCVELIPGNRRYLMTACYVMFGAASSSACVMRVYMIYVSSRSDRARAYSFMALAHLASIIVGPLCQLIFTTIPYPGIEIIKGVHFHVYSAPVWVSAALTFLSMYIIQFKLTELPPKVKQEEESESIYTLEGLKKRWSSVKAMDICWTVVIICWIEKIVLGFTMTMMMTVSGPMKMTLFSLTGNNVVLISSLSAVIVGVLASSVVGVTVVTNCTKRIPSRYFLLYSIFILLLLYVFSYPYPFDSHPLQPYNETTGTGCNPLEYDWCETAKATSLFVYIPVMITTMGMGVPLGFISLDTIYSHVLGNIDQSLMQGAFVVAEDIIQFFGPIYSASMYSAFGQGPLWISNGFITLIGLALWIAAMGKLKKHT